MSLAEAARGAWQRLYVAAVVWGAPSGTLHGRHDLPAMAAALERASRYGLVRGGAELALLVAQDVSWPRLVGGVRNAFTAASVGMFVLGVRWYAATQRYEVLGVTYAGELRRFATTGPERPHPGELWSRFRNDPWCRVAERVARKVWSRGESHWRPVEFLPESVMDELERRR